MPRCEMLHVVVDDERQRGEGCRSTIERRVSVLEPGQHGRFSSAPPIVNFPIVVQDCPRPLLRLSFHFPHGLSFPYPSFRLLLRASSPSCSYLSRRCLDRSSERHRYFSPVSQRQLTAAGRSPVPSCTAADKDPMAADERRKHTRAGQSAGSPVAADCIGRAPVLLSSIPPVR